MKHFLSIAVISAFALSLGAAELNVSVNRTVAVEGDVFHFTMTYDETPDTIQLPDLENGEWLKNVQQRGTSIVNGKRTTSFSVGLRGLKPGILKIPSFTLKFNDKPVESKPLQVRIVPRGEQPVSTGNSGGSIPMKEALFGTARYDGARTSCYVGESVPLRLSLYALPSLRPRLIQLPKLEEKSLLFKSYRWRDGSMREFREPESRERVLNGRTYAEIEFFTEFRAISPGKITPKAEITLEVSQSRQRDRGLPFDDDFFGSFDGKPYQVVFAAPPALEVKPLPPSPAGVIPLPLVGSWKVEGSFDKQDVKVGEALTLNLKISGSGVTDGISAPKLSFDSFRSYPAELKQEDGTLLIRYALIPLKAGDFESLLKFSTFNPQTEQYETHDVALVLAILPGETRSGLTVDEGNEDSPRPPAPPKEQERTELFYQKADSGKAVKLPLYTNTLPLVLVLAGAGLLIVVIGETGRFLRRRAAKDPASSRRRRCRQQLPAIVSELKKCTTAETFDRTLQEKALPFLAEALSLPPGATASEIAAEIEVPEIRTILENSGENSFLPGSASREFRPELPGQLIRFLKRFSLILLLLAGVKAGASFEAGNDLFARGEFQQALKAYQADLSSSAPSANVLYNIGGAAWQLNDLPLARINLERARLLAPRDHEIRENLNLVNRKLMQVQATRVDGFGALLIYCRDYLRPDEHMLPAAALFLILCVLFELRYRIPRTLCRSLTIGVLLLLFLSTAAIVSQYHSSYSSARSIVNGQMELRTLPGDRIGSVSATIPGGSSATILEKRGDFYKIECNGRTGWAPVERVTPLL